MFHSTIVPNDTRAHKLTSTVALLSYISSHKEALGHAAVLLSGRRGARLINEIQEALGQPDPLTRRLIRHLLDLRRLLSLEYAHDENWRGDECFAMLEPYDPIVPEICLLADGLDHVLRNAGLFDLDYIKAA